MCEETSSLELQRGISVTDDLHTHSVKALFLKDSDTVLEDPPTQIAKFISAALGKVVSHENRQFHLAGRLAMLLKETGFLIDDLMKDLASGWHRILSCRAFDEVDSFDVNTSEFPLADMKRDLRR